MRREKKSAIKRLICVTNLVKFTLGLPLLILVTLLFFCKISKQLFKLLIDITLYPANIRDDLRNLLILLTDMITLWSTNKLIDDVEDEG